MYRFDVAFRSRQQRDAHISLAVDSFRVLEYIQPHPIAQRKTCPCGTLLFRGSNEKHNIACCSASFCFWRKARPRGWTCEDYVRNFGRRRSARTWALRRQISIFLWWEDVDEERKQERRMEELLYLLQCVKTCVPRFDFDESMDHHPN